LKGILFSTEMVQAILEGRKTVTRRVVKSQYSDSIFEMYEGILCETEPKTPSVDLGNGHTKHKVRRFVECKQPYQVGDYLYVRETWQEVGTIYKFPTHIIYKASPDICPKTCPYSDGEKWIDLGQTWRPSIHMPKSAARILLKVTDVKAERLQDITIEQLVKEGFGNVIHPIDTPWYEIARKEFKETFFKIYPNCTEESYVWVIEFERVEKVIE